MNNLPTILFVDDEPINLMLFKVNFKKRFNVVTADSALNGMNQLKENAEIKVVISDMKMPNMDGIDFILMAKREFPNLPFFILTGFDITEEISAALDEKLIYKYFRKPFNINEIEFAINECIDKID